jgi:RNA polymerase sigma-70 factor (ECF subfamily)
LGRGGERTARLGIGALGTDNAYVPLADPSWSTEASTGFEDILVQARAGFPPACRALYDAYAGQVLGYLRLRGADDAEDLTSEVFLRVFSRLHDFRGDERGFRGWVFTIAHRVLIDEHRRRTRRPTMVALGESRPSALVAGNVETDALGRLGDRDVRELLDELTPDQRDVLALRIVADLPIEEVARILRRSPGTVKSLQHRGIAALRRRLDGDAR